MGADRLLSQDLTVIASSKNIPSQIIESQMLVVIVGSLCSIQSIAVFATVLYLNNFIFLISSLEARFGESAAAVAGIVLRRLCLGIDGYTAQ